MLCLLNISTLVWFCSVIKKWVKHVTCKLLEEKDLPATELSFDPSSYSRPCKETCTGDLCHVRPQRGPCCSAPTPSLQHWERVGGPAPQPASCSSHHSSICDTKLAWMNSHSFPKNELSASSFFLLIFCSVPFPNRLWNIERSNWNAVSFQASSQRQHLLAASHCEPAASLRVGLPKGQHNVCEALRGGVQAWATPQLHSEGSPVHFWSTVDYFPKAKWPRAQA